MVDKQSIIKPHPYKQPITVQFNLFLQVLPVNYHPINNTNNIINTQYCLHSLVITLFGRTTQIHRFLPSPLPPLRHNLLFPNLLNIITSTNINTNTNTSLPQSQPHRQLVQQRTTGNFNLYHTIPHLLHLLLLGLLQQHLRVQ